MSLYKPHNFSLGTSVPALRTWDGAFVGAEEASLPVVEVHMAKIKHKTRKTARKALAFRLDGRHGLKWDRTVVVFFQKAFSFSGFVV
jgi:hypothetical protein